MKIASFEVLMQLLRDRPVFLTEIQQQKNLDKKIVSLLFNYISQFWLVEQ
jgi:hypothetical protein